MTLRFLGNDLQTDTHRRDHLPPTSRSSVNWLLRGDYDERADTLTEFPDLISPVQQSRNKPTTFPSDRNFLLYCGRGTSSPEEVETVLSPNGLCREGRGSEVPSSHAISKILRLVLRRITLL